VDILFEKVYTLVTITPQGCGRKRKVEVQEMGLNLSGMTTETRNPRTMQLDQMSPLEIVTVMTFSKASAAPVTPRAVCGRGLGKGTPARGPPS